MVKHVFYEYALFEIFGQDSQVVLIDKTACGCYIRRMITSKISIVDPRALNDSALLDYAILYGGVALRARNKFVGSLPEVARRGLYLKKGFESIFHFAKMTGGVSEEQVRNVLNLSRKFENMPHLSRLLATGRVSINKLIRITSVVTVENDEYWANQVQILSYRSIETSVRDYNLAKIDDVTAKRDFEDRTQWKSVQKTTPLEQAQNPSSELRAQLATPLEERSVKSNVFTNQELTLDVDVQRKLLELQQNGIDINSELREFLVMREAQIEDDKERLGAEQDSKALKGETSEHIPVEIKKLLKKEYGTRCSQPGCTKPAEQIHHANRFSMARSHNPKFLAPMCVAHHQIAHAVDVKATEMRQNRRT